MVGRAPPHRFAALATLLTGCWSSVGGMSGVSHDNHGSTRVVALVQADLGLRARRDARYERILNEPGPFGFEAGLSYALAERQPRLLAGFSPIAHSWIPTSARRLGLRVRFGLRLEVGDGTDFFGLVEVTPLYAARIVDKPRPGPYQRGYGHHHLEVPVEIGIGARANEDDSELLVRAMIGVAYRYVALFPILVRERDRAAPALDPVAPAPH